MENFSIKFIPQDGFLEFVCLGVWLGVDDVMEYASKVVNECSTKELNLVLLNQNLLYISLTDKEVHQLIQRLKQEVEGSFDLHFFITN